MPGDLIYSVMPLILVALLAVFLCFGVVVVIARRA